MIVIFKGKVKIQSTTIKPGARQTLPPGKVPRGDAPEGEPGLTGDLQTIKDATARAGDDGPGTLRKFMKPGSMWKASTDSSSTAKSPTRQCANTSVLPPPRQRLS